MASQPRGHNGRGTSDARPATAGLGRAEYSPHCQLEGERVGVPAGGLLAGWVARLRSRQAETVVPAAQPPTRPEQGRGQGASSQWSNGANYFGTRVVVRGLGAGLKKAAPGSNAPTATFQESGTRETSRPSRGSAR